MPQMKSFNLPTFQFSIVRLLIVTTVVAFLVAALKGETLTSMARLLGGCLTASMIPFLVVTTFRNIAQWKKRHKLATGQNSQSVATRVPTLWLSGLIGTVCLACLFCHSVVSEAFEFTTGLTPWIVPAGLLAGCVWQIRRQTDSGIKLSPSQEGLSLPSGTDRD